MLEKTSKEHLELTVRRYASTGGALGDAADYHLSRPGKRNRSRLLYAAAGSNVASWQIAACAGACELVHEASIVHDDLQDVELQRRGQPAVWQRFGEDTALLLGDHLIASAFRALANAPLDPSSCNRMTNQLATAVSRAASGQHLQTLLSPDGSELRKVYEMVARGKTGALLALPLQFAGVLRSVSAAEAAALEACGEQLGLAYQIANDVSSMSDSSPGSDLRAGVVTAAIVVAKSLAPKEDPFNLLLEDETASAQVRMQCHTWLAEVTAQALAETSMLPLDISSAIRSFVAKSMESSGKHHHGTPSAAQESLIRRVAAG